jgi:hypothetical protein
VRKRCKEKEQDTQTKGKTNPEVIGRVHIEANKQPWRPNFYNCTNPSEPFPHMPATKKRRVIIGNDGKETSNNSHSCTPIKR